MLKNETDAELDLNQISIRLLTSFNQYTVNLLTFTVN